jgi:hypothetical protein
MCTAAIAIYHHNFPILMNTLAWTNVDTTEAVDAFFVVNPDWRIVK